MLPRRFVPSLTVRSANGSASLYPSRIFVIAAGFMAAILHQGNETINNRSRVA